ncbi:MAG TPA: decarboxylase [Candidatus Methylomirabilis sp.]|nr:decarboxylase [Candidatus Methylomirabilis sp.]
MLWTESIVAALKRHEVKLIAYLPDSIVYRVLALLEQDPFFDMVPVAREEEGVGILAGAYLGGRRGALFAQNSGLGNCVNALASLAVPWQTPFLIFLSQRGELGEFNVSQTGMGRATRPILDALGIPHVTPTHPEEVEGLVSDGIKLVYSTRTPLGVLLSRQLTGGKNE